MQQKLPEEGKEYYVEFDAKKENDSIVITTNLPEQCEIFIKDNKSKYSKKMTVSNGTIEIKNATDISKVIINSGVFTADVNTQQIIGENCRNLVGKFIKYHPIYGNQIHCIFEF